MKLPLNDCKITSEYGVIRSDKKLHKGIDLISTSGDRNVKAIRSGTVSYVGYDATGFGNYVVILQEDGYKALYCHLKSYNVKANELVEEGKIIGIEGTSGNSTGVHLHLELRKTPYGREDHINVAEYLFINNKKGYVEHTIPNYEEFEYLGILDYWRKGYEGQGITICSKENVLENVFDDVFGLEYEKDRSNKYSIHGTTVMDYIRQVAPKATKWAIETKGKITGPTDNRVLESEGMDFLQENVPDVLTTSFFKMTDIEEPKKSLYKQLYDKGCFMCLSAGNKNEEIEKLAEGDVWKAIGACRFNKGKPQVEKDYAQGKEMDFISFHRLVALWDKLENKDIGTSFSSPLFAGMVALVQCYFKETAGRKLTHDELMKFIKDNCIDLEEQGRDDKTGYGLFVLPKPWKIEYTKYLNEEEEEMRYQKLEEIPDWGKPTVEKLMKLELLKGDENGNLDLSHDMLRIFVIEDRAGLYDF